MALPKLSVPEYELELPSNQQKVRYRPFLVKEQKILMIAEEGKDEQEIIKAIKQIISACTLSKDVDISSLPLFDIEYFFLQLRSKSIGEKVKVGNVNLYNLTFSHKNIKNTRLLFLTMIKLY